MKKILLTIGSLLILLLSCSICAMAANTEYVSVASPAGGTKYIVNNEITIKLQTNGCKGDRWGRMQDYAGVVITKDGKEVFNQRKSFDNAGQMVQYNVGEDRFWVWPNKLGSVLEYKYTPTSAGTYTFNVYFAPIYDYETDGPELVDTRTFTVVAKPKATSIVKLTAVKKGFTVKWKKKAYNGYQIRYSTKSGMSGAKSVWIKKNSTVSKKITKLKAKKKYYVQVRTYRTVGGKKYYSAWSGKKSIKTK